MSLRGKLFAFLYRWHRWLGLFLALHLLLLFVSGILLLFKDEWQANPLAPSRGAPEKISKSEGELPLQTLLDTALRRHPAERPLAISFDDHDKNKVTLRLAGEQTERLRDARRILFDRSTGLETAAPAPGGFWDFVLRLHREFLLGFYGKLYVGLIGLLLLASLGSGFYLYGPLSKRQGFAAIRRGRWRWTLADLHRYGGASSFAWLALMATTGFFLAFSGQFLKLYQYTELKALRAAYSAVEPPAAIVSVSRAEAAIRERLPGAPIDFIAFPNSEFSTPQHFIFVVSGDQDWNRYLSQLVLVDAATGRLSEIRPIPWYLKILVLSEPLHFGNYGGLPLKIAWAALAVFGLFLSLGGLALSLIRKNSRRKSQKARTPVAKASRAPASPYALPLFFSMLVSGASIGALVTEGVGDALASLLIAGPLAYLALRVFLNLRRSPLPSEESRS